MNTRVVAATPSDNWMWRSSAPLPGKNFSNYTSDPLLSVANRCSLVANSWSQKAKETRLHLDLSTWESRISTARGAEHIELRRLALR